MGPQAIHAYRFGIYEVDLKTGELRKSGVRLRLPDQALRVLVSMLERPSEIITREELRLKLWPEGTFVDFDHGLNTIVNKLRETLGDTAGNPRFIETLARRGYRFIAPVEFAGEDKTNPGNAQASAGSITRHPSPAASSGLVLTRADEVPAAGRGKVRFLFLLLQVTYVIFYVTALARLGRIQDVLDPFAYAKWIIAVLVISAGMGIPVRLFLISAITFDLAGLTTKFSRIFFGILILDELWAVAPFLLAPQIGLGLALASSAILIYSPFAQRTLLLIADRGLTV